VTRLQTETQDLRGERPLMSRPLLPFEIKNALVEVCGRAFWFKQPLFDVFARAGIPEALYLQHEDEAKFKIARHVIGELERMGEEGFFLQQRLVTELCSLKTLPDSEVPDRDAAVRTLRKLKELAVQHHIEAADRGDRANRAAADARARVERVRERQQRLEELAGAFREMTLAADHQARGYQLEDLVKELFALHEIRYRKSYRAAGEQVDGSFQFGGFDYLVETRWRQEAPALDELLAFKGKVDRKIESTRGLFVSVPGFRPEVVERLREAGAAKLILMDGRDLAVILEGLVTLTDALQAKVDKAYQEGVVYFQLCGGAPTKRDK